MKFLFQAIVFQLLFAMKDEEEQQEIRVCG